MCCDLFPGQKVKVTPVIWKEGQSHFLPCLPHDSILICLNHFICGIHTTHEVTRCRAPFSRSKVKGRSIFLPCQLCSSVPISLIHFIWDTCTTHEVTMCCAPFPDQKNKGQGHMSHLNFVMSVVSCLFDRITSYMAYIQHMRGRCVVHHFQDESSKVKVIWIFRFFYRVLSAAPSLFHRFSSYDIHTTHEVTMCRAQFPGRNVKGHGHTDDLKCSLHGFLLIWPNHVICVIHTTYEDAMCRVPFSGWKVKGQGHTGHFKCYLSTCITEAAHKGTMCRAPLPDQRSRSHRSLQVLSRLFRDGTDWTSIGLSVPVSLIHIFMH